MMPSSTKAPLVIGVTGITGSGASTLAECLKECGGLVISADAISHDVLQYEAHDEVVDAFGRDILQDGQVSRQRLGAVVFGCHAKLARLEGILHPKILQRITSQVSEVGRMIPGAISEFAVIDAPLLIESGLHRICDYVWLVCAAEEVRIARLWERSGIDADEARRRIGARQSDKELMAHADLVFENNEGVEELRRKARYALKRAMLLHHGYEHPAFDE